MVKVLFIIQVSLVLLVMIVCPTRTDEANAEMVENFVSHYYLKPDPQRVPPILDIVLKDLGDQEDVQNVLVGHAFGHMARGNQKLIRLYESRFLNATDTGRVFLVEALRICGDDLTRDKLEKWSRDPAYKHQQRRLESAVTFLVDRKRRLPRDRPAETPMDLDLLWADFFTTGEYAPVARILDTLDQPGELR